MRVRRDIVLFGIVAAVALGGAWWLLTNKPGAAVEAYRREAEARASNAKAGSASADMFRATVCAERGCTLVEAGGLSFLFGAGKGAAEGMAELGLLRADMDAVLLPELRLDVLEGMAGVASAVKAAGRVEPLKVYGGQGIVAVVDGANLLMSSDHAAKLVVGIEGEDQGIDGRVVFDSGVVTIRSFLGSGAPSDRVYRVDFEDKSLVVAGCAASGQTIVAAASGMRTVAGILAAGSERLSGDAVGCLDVGAALGAAVQGKLVATIVVPHRDNRAVAAWKDLVSEAKGGDVRVGVLGTQIDLTGPAPTTRN